MSLRSLFDSIVARSSEARKCYDVGMYAESLNLVALVQEDTRICMQALHQAMDAQNPEVPLKTNAYLTSQSQAASGESSMEGSMTMETTPPQTFSGISPSSLKRKPSSGRPQSTRKSSRPSSPPLQRQLAPLKTEPSTPPSSYYQRDFSTPQHHVLHRPQTIVASQSLPHDLNLLQSQGGPFVTPHIPQSPYAGYPNPSYPAFRSQPGTPYFAPNTLRMTPQIYQSPTTMDFGRQTHFQATNPINLIDPRNNPALQFRRPSEPTIPTHSQFSHTPAATPATPIINLPGQTMSFPSPLPTNTSSGESPFPPSLLPQLDGLFVTFLQRVVSDESITDGRGEALHHPLPPRKQQKAHALPLTSWRPVKLRIQAFTSAFQEELARTLAAGMNLARHEVSIKRVREYLWTRDLIARYNPSGRKAKSRGSHVWCVEARRRAEDAHAEWEFRPWKRKIQVMRDSLVVLWGQLLRLPLKVWDPQVQYEDLEVKYSVRGQLPSWLSWESDSVLAGTPPAPADEEPYKVPIAVSASYSAFGMSHVIDSRLELDVRAPGSTVGDLSSSLRSASGLQSASTTAPFDAGMEAYLDDDDDDMMYVSQHQFSSETNTPPSAITPSMANPNQLLYVPSQSLQNSPLKQSPMGPTPPPSGPGLINTSLQTLTPTLSPASLQFNQHVVGTTPRQPTSAPQTPLGGPPSQLSLQIPPQSHDSLPSGSGGGGQQSQQNLRFNMNDVQPNVMYGLQTHMRLSPPASAESGTRMYGIDEELGSEHEHNSTTGGHGYFDDSYPLELGSPFLER